MRAKPCPTSIPAITTSRDGGAAVFGQFKHGNCVSVARKGLDQGAREDGEQTEIFAAGNEDGTSRETKTNNLIRGPKCLDADAGSPVIKFGLAFRRAR